SPHIVRADSGQYCSSSLENPDRWAYCQFGLDRGASVASLPEAVQKPVTLGERVRAARHALGLSQAQLAGDELTKGFISQVEAGLVRPSLRSLQIIASRLGRSLDYLIRAESLEAARDVMEQREITDPRLRARTLVHLGTVYRRLHRTVKALATYELALAVASRSSELRLAAQSYMGVAVALYDAGELDGAIGNYQRALG